MGKQRSIKCPFCGERGSASKEHVWAKWLRRLPGAKELLADADGTQVSIPRYVTTSAEGGRFRVVDDDPVRVAELLPNVTVKVCPACNNGWMSDLEDKVQQILEGYFSAAFPVPLREPEMVTLSAWATKSWMSYATLSGPLKNPFTEHNYRALAADHRPLARTRVWLLHSHAPTAHVGIGVASFPMTPLDEPPDLHQPDNAGWAFLAAGTVVLYMAIAPEGREEMLDLLAPDVMQELPGMRRIWPPAEDVVVFPGPRVEDRVLSHLLSWPTYFANVLGLPSEGLTPAELQEVQDQYARGGDPRIIRERWQGAIEGQDEVETS